MEVRYYLRSLQCTVRATKSIHLSLHFRNSGWDHKHLYFPLMVPGPHHIYRNGKVITFLPGNKWLHFFFFPRHIEFMHSVWFLSWASFYIYLHWISDDISSPIIQPLPVLSLTAGDSALWLTLDEQTSKSSWELHWFLQHEGALTQIHKLAGVLRPPGLPGTVTHISQPCCGGVLIRFKPSGNARIPHKGSKGRFVLQAADLPLLHLHGHSHGEKPRGNRATPSSGCAWMHFVSCTVLLHWPEDHWLGAGRKLWLNKLVALFVALLVVGFMDFFLIGRNPTTI